MKFKLFLIISSVYFSLNAQSQGALDYPYSILMDSKMYSDTNNHTAIKPIFCLTTDSQKKSIFLPVANIITGNRFQFLSAGIYYKQSIKNISFDVLLMPSITLPSDSLKNLSDSIGIYPSFGHYKELNKWWFFINAQASLLWKALPYLHFKAGYGNNFLGDGIRSLFLSDNTAFYPYIQGQAKIWRIQYLVQYNFLYEPTYKSFNIPFHQKYSTWHFLSWNVTNRLNINAFETVVWQGKDSIGHRGFDVNYLNPFIFFRPVEFSIGSPDNVLMGMGFRFKFLKNIHWYGQFLLDEFKISEIKSQQGWWGNKFAFQQGIKIFDVFNIKNLYLQAECNVIRPFTYSHSDYMNNWGYQHQPMAHPNGSNLIEWIANVAYYSNRWIYSIQFNYLRQGISDTSFNAGDNIYQSYNSHRQEYGYHLLKGTNRYLFELTTNVSYQIFKKYPYFLFCSLTYNHHYLEQLKRCPYYWITTGVRIPLVKTIPNF